MLIKMGHTSHDTNYNQKLNNRMGPVWSLWHVLDVTTLLFQLSAAPVQCATDKVWIRMWWGWSGDFDFCGSKIEFLKPVCVCVCLHTELGRLHSSERVTTESSRDGWHLYPRFGWENFPNYINSTLLVIPAWSPGSGRIVRLSSTEKACWDD